MFSLLKWECLKCKGIRRVLDSNSAHHLAYEYSFESPKRTDKEGVESTESLQHQSGFNEKTKQARQAHYVGTGSDEKTKQARQAHYVGKTAVLNVLGVDVMINLTK